MPHTALPIDFQGMRRILGDLPKLPVPNQPLRVEVEKPAGLALHDFRLLLQVGFDDFQFSATVVASVFLFLFLIAKHVLSAPKGYVYIRIRIIFKLWHNEKK
jgi:hypothetical protein